MLRCVLAMRGFFRNTVERYAHDGRDDAMRPGGCSHGLPLYLSQ
jgi:hypothetical protein